MSCAGYVLTGGRSSRMGVDKALLSFGGRTLIEHVAGEVRRAASAVSLVGPVAAYEHLGLRVLEDRHPGLGPLSGIETALRDSTGDWNLIVACDLPNLDSSFLHELLQQAAAGADAEKIDALLPCGPSGLPEPLCGVYHRRCLDAVSVALRAGRYKVTAALESMRVKVVPVSDGRWFENANTPGDWQRILRNRAWPPDS